MTSTARSPLSEAAVRALLDDLSNWGRWGQDELLGTLNYLTAEHVRSAAAQVTDGVTVSCSVPITCERVPDDASSAGPQPPRVYDQPMHMMLQAGEGLDPESSTRHGPADLYILPPHGLGMTHLDAPSHTLYRGTMYNGVPASQVQVRAGALSGDVELVRNGIVGRGVLFDVPRVLGRDWLDDSEAVYPEDLEACEAAQGVCVGKGDILLVRTGYRARKPLGPASTAGGYPGLQAACLPWLHEREVAVLATDSAADVWPAQYSLGVPVHTVGMWAMGLWIVDNCDFERLASECVVRHRWAMHFTIAPLVLRHGTGSPINPIATF